MVRVAMLSFWHVHARDYARQAAEHPEVEIVAAWDEEPARGRAEAAALGVRWCGDLDEVLAASDVDGVIVDTPTDRHPAVIRAAVRAGKHVFTEKVLALDPADAAGIVEDARTAGVALVVSLPRLYHGYTQAIDGVLATGRLGEVTLVRTRLAHDGAVGAGWLPAHFFDPVACGGGAMVDLGCHPMYLNRHFAGALPTAVQATYGHVTGRAVEDNAVAVLTYPGGRIGVVEAGFAARHAPFTVEIHGTDGMLVYGLPEPRLLVRAGDDAEWTEVDVPPDAPTPFEQWVRAIGTGDHAADNVVAAVDLTRLMAAANRSVHSGTAEDPA